MGMGACDKRYTLHGPNISPAATNIMVVSYVKSHCLGYCKTSLCFLHPCLSSVLLIRNHVGKVRPSSVQQLQPSSHAQLQYGCQPAYASKNIANKTAHYVTILQQLNQEIIRIIGYLFQLGLANHKCYHSFIQHV